jgi:hypothetical protein
MLVTTAALPACAGDGDVNHLTLTDAECIYHGEVEVPADRTFEVELENESSRLGAFEIAKLDAGNTFADVGAYVESERQRLEDGLQIAGPPTYLTLGARAQVPAGESGTLVSTVTSGEWILWCAHDHPPTALFLVRPPLEVAE